MATVAITHKKMKIISEELAKVVENEDNREKFIKFLKELFKYQEDKVFNNTYSKERYEAYIKPYREKNRDKINKKRNETLKLQRQQRKLQKKEEEELIINSTIEEKLNNIKI